MQFKRVLAVVLAAVLMCGGIPAPARAAEAQAAAFTDIADPEVAQCAELLRQLGIVAGDGTGSYYPDQLLTRAQFCRMAVDIRGEGDKARALLNYTFFNDVKGDHWARGYINYASRVTVEGRDERLVMGVGDGRFLPDVDIRFAEAVAMTMRLLGYSQQDVSAGATWYDGYLSTAGEIKLLEGLSVSPETPLTRAQAAVLFKNLLFTVPRAGGEPFFTALGGSRTGEVLVLAVDAAGGTVKVSEGGGVSVYKTAVPLDPALAGSRAELMLNGDKKVMAARTAETCTAREIVLSVAGESFAVTRTGERVSIPADTAVYDGSALTTYGAVRGELAQGARLTLYTDAAGKLTHVFFTPVQAEQGEGRREAITLAAALPTYVESDAGERITVSPAATVYENGLPTTYAQVYATLEKGLRLTLSYGIDGRLEYMLLDRAAEEGENSYVSMTVAAAGPTYVDSDAGERLTVAPTAVIYENGQTTTYAQVYTTLEKGSKLTFCYDGAGKLAYISLVRPAAAVGESSYKTVTVAAAGPTYVESDAGERLTVAPTAVIYENGQTTTYAQVYTTLEKGSRLTFCYDAAGKLEYISLTRAAAGEGENSYKTVTVAAAGPSYVDSDAGERVSIAPGTAAYQGGKTTTYGEVYSTLAAGDQLTLCYSAAGKLEYVFLAGGSAPVKGEDTYRTVTAAVAETSYIITPEGERVNISPDAAVYFNGEKTTYALAHTQWRSGLTVTLCYGPSGELEYAFCSQESAAPVSGDRKVTLALVEAGYIRTAAGERIPVPADTAVYVNGKKTSYGRVYLDLTTGTEAILSYNDDGRLEYIWLTADVDLADKAAAALTCIYEAASPSPSSPTAVQVLGAELEVTDAGAEALAGFSLGDPVTLYLTADGRVVNAAAPSGSEPRLVGVVTSVTEGEDDAEVSVRLLGLHSADGGDLVLTGKAAATRKLAGALVSVVSRSRGRLALTQVSGSAAPGALDVKARTLNGEALPARVRLYERTGGGLPVEITWGQLTVDRVTKDKISYVGTDAGGEVNALVLEDVTGDGYLYGFVAGVAEENSSYGLSGNEEKYYTYYLEVDGSGGTRRFRTLSTGSFKAAGIPGGVAPDAQDWAGASMALTEVKRVSRSNFNMEDMTVDLTGVTWPVAENVQCWNRATGTWLGAGREALEAARTYAAAMTVYYDKAPELGGKVRMVAVG